MKILLLIFHYFLLKFIYFKNHNLLNTFQAILLNQVSSYFDFQLFNVFFMHFITFEKIMDYSIPLLLIAYFIEIIKFYKN